MEALPANIPVTGLPLALEVDYFRLTPTSYYVPVSVKVPGSVIALAQKTGGAAASPEKSPVAASRHHHA